MPRALRRRSVRFPSSPPPASVTRTGVDGGEGKPPDAAGAAVDATTLAGVRHLDAKNFLHNNEATSFFEAAGGLIVRGPTHTNVNDFRVILVDA